MTGILAQVISLTSYGNAFLQADEFAEDFYPSNSTFQFCNKVDFKNFRKRIFSSSPREVPVANDPNEWFRFLKKDGCKKIRLYYQPAGKKEPAPDHKLAGLVGGGGTWMIETIYGRYSHYWFNRWEVTKKDDPDRKIWSVSYAMTDKDQPVTDVQMDIRETYSQLEESLIAITDFADAQQLSDWAVVFKKARAVLNSTDPARDYYHQDLLVEKHYSLIARQLLFATGAAWVFGGMGSWNDLGFNTEEDNKKYDDVSAGLYAAINQSVLAVANSY
ncbi:MAG: hypothetical protein J0H74_05540 [Chitinophagaceae bacterium]|nr:hypothetical protein [Chitinophagaceae bacterium]